MAEKGFKPGFILVWPDEILDLRNLSKTAFILRYIYRLFRNSKDNICNISDLRIRELTGFDREAIRKARQKLIALNELTPLSYHSYKVKVFNQFRVDGNTANWRKNPQPHLTDKPPIGGGNTANHLTDKPPIGGGNTANPIYKDKDNKDKDTDKVCLYCKIYDPEHLNNKGDKAGYCPVLLAALPPFTNASSCENFTQKESEVQV